LHYDIIPSKLKTFFCVAAARRRPWPPHSQGF